MPMKNKKSFRATKGFGSKRTQLIIFAILFGMTGAWLLRSTFAATAFSDNFESYPTGLITSEYTYWNPTSSSAKKNANWDVTSGALFAATLNNEHVAYSGYPTYNTSIGPSPTVTSGNDSAIFRATTTSSNIGNADVSFRLFNKQMVTTSGTPAVAWDGIHVFLRYLSEYNLYYASVNRRDGALAIKKKIPGGTSNGGTYYTLADTSANKYPIPYNTWQNIKTTIRTNADNSVTIQIFANGVLLLSATDNGSIGGPAITSPGKSGIRGDNDEFYFDDFLVNNPDVVDPTPPQPPTTTDTTLPVTSLTSPVNGATLTGQVKLTATASDNMSVAKVEFYDGPTLVGATNTAPYAFTWDTTKVSNGTHSLTAKAYDASQNVGVSNSAAVTVSNTTTAPDTITPVVRITSPLNGAVVGKKVSIKATATDNTKVAKMYVYVDGVLKSNSSTGSISTSTSVNSGTHTITVTAVDAAGNIGRSAITVRR